MKHQNRSRRVTSAALLAAGAFAAFAHADVIDTTWLGGTGSWNDPTKFRG